MAFYNYKIREYSLTRNPHRLPKQDRLDLAKESVEKAYEGSIKANEGIKERLLKSAAVANPQRGMAVAQFQTNMLNEKILEDKAALEYISSLSTLNYFKLLEKKEETELGEYIDSRFEKMGEATERLIKLENNKGVVAKFYALTGKSEEKIAEANAQFEQANLEVVNAQEALEEWKTLRIPDRQDYLIERFEHEGLLSLDTQGLESYIENKEELMQPIPFEPKLMEQE